MEVLPHVGRRGRLGIARTAWLTLGSIGLVAGSLFASVAPAGATNSKITLSQCANGGGGTLLSCTGAGSGGGSTGYVNGNLNGQKSHWAEGDFVSFQLEIDSLTAAQHTVVLQYRTVTNGHHAYDYLGSFDATETTGAATLAHANQNDPCSAIIPSCDPASPTAHIGIPKPDLSGLNAACSSSGTPPTFPNSTTGDLKMWGPSGTTLDGISYVTPINQVVQNNPTSKDCFTSVQVKFTPSAAGTVVLAWGGHVASQLDWGSGNAAGNISGSPYHMLVVSLDGDSAGAVDRSMKVTASQPTIATVIRDAANTPVTVVPSGTVVHDTATLSGAASNAGGTVTYRLFSGGTCSGDVIHTYPAVTVVNGIVPDSPSFTTTPGTYSYKATYSGDGNDSPATGACEGPLTVTEETAPLINVVKAEPTPGDGKTVTAGQSAPITYTLAVTNSGSADATSEVVTDVVPAGTTYVAGSAGPSAANPQYDSTTHTITWTIPTIAAESGSTPGEVDLTFQVTVNSSDAAGSTIVNVASFANVNTPGCGDSETCLTNEVRNPVIVITPGTNPLVTTTTTTVKPTTTTTKKALAFTGSQSGLLGALGAGLVGSGGLVLLLNRRRGSSGKHFAQK